jgi:hypothetical protein
MNEPAALLVKETPTTFPADREPRVETTSCLPSITDGVRRIAVARPD